MSTDVAQPRAPAGRPDGGQFAGTPPPARPAAMGDHDVELPPLTDTEYNEHGSYGYPPAPRSAGQHLLFWFRQVHVPEDVLLRVQAEYSRIRNLERVAARITAEEGHTGVIEGQKKRGPKHSCETPRDMIACMDRADLAERARAPMHLWTIDVRPIVLAERAYASALQLPEDERSVVHEFRIPVAQLQREITVLEAREIFNLKERCGEALRPVDLASRLDELLRQSGG